MLLIFIKYPLLSGIVWQVINLDLEPVLWPFIIISDLSFTSIVNIWYTYMISVFISLPVTIIISIDAFYNYLGNLYKIVNYK